MRSNSRGGGVPATESRPRRPAALGADRRGRAPSRPRIAPHGHHDQATTELALAARRGETNALEAFVRATRADVWRFVASLAGTQSADDLTQETYIRALGGLPRFAGRSHARPWLLAIARRVVADHFRSRAARPTTVGTDWRTAFDQRDRDESPCFDEEFALLELLERLTSDRREAFFLTQVAGFSYAEVAAMTDCPVGTVRSRIARARRDLVTALRPPDRSAELTGRPA